MTLTKLKSGFKTVGFASEGIDKNGEITLSLNIISDFELSKDREIRIFKNNNKEINYPYVVIGKKKAAADDEFADLERFKV